MPTVVVLKHTIISFLINWTASIVWSIGSDPMGDDDAFFSVYDETAVEDAHKTLSFHSLLHRP